LNISMLLCAIAGRTPTDAYFYENGENYTGSTQTIKEGGHTLKNIFALSIAAVLLFSAASAAFAQPAGGGTTGGGTTGGAASPSPATSPSPSPAMPRTGLGGASE
jgi:hypothetical protein